MNVTQATQGAASFNCVENYRNQTIFCLLSAITYLFLDSLALASQGVLHFIRADDHFPNKQRCCYCMDAALCFSFLGALQASEQRQKACRRRQSVAGQSEA